MPCERVRAQLTAYLDGELDGDRGTVVRGHLRTCEACRGVASDESVLRDGLRALPSLDPPSTLWAGVQARLAASEVAESERPAWRRAFTRWSAWMPSVPRLAAGGLVAAAAVTVIWWKTERTESAYVVHGGKPSEFQGGTPSTPAKPAKPLEAPAGDVTVDLAGEGARVTASYTAAIDELLALADEVRPTWSSFRKSAFDDKVRLMQDAIAKADEGRPRQRASRALIGYLQGAVIREDVLLASRGDR